MRGLLEIATLVATATALVAPTRTIIRQKKLITRNNDELGLADAWDGALDGVMDALVAGLDAMGVDGAAMGLGADALLLADPAVAAGAAAASRFKRLRLKLSAMSFDARASRSIGDRFFSSQKRRRQPTGSSRNALTAPETPSLIICTTASLRSGDHDAIV